MGSQFLRESRDVNEVYLAFPRGVFQLGISVWVVIFLLQESNSSSLSPPKVPTVPEGTNNMVILYLPVILFSHQPGSVVEHSYHKDIVVRQMVRWEVRILVHVVVVWVE